MGTEIGYTSRDHTSESIGREVIRFCDAESQRYQWASEGVCLTFDEAAERLEGWTKFSPESWSAHQAGLSELGQLVEILAIAARRFSLSWRIQFFDNEGTIDANGPDKFIVSLLNETKSILDADTQAKGQRGKWLPARKLRFRKAGAQLLRRRWTSSDAIEVLEDVFLRGVTGRSPFGVTDAGHVDLRGIDLTLLFAQYPRIFLDLERACRDITNVDLSFSNVDDNSGQWALRWLFHFHESVLDGIKTPCGLCGEYDHCSLKGMVLDDTYVALRDCDLSFLSMHRHWSSPERCILDYSDITRSIMTGQSFLECSFRNCNLNSVEMGLAKFVRCNFEGASFDNTFYCNTVFEQCSGLNVERMQSNSNISFGMKLCEAKDIVIH